MYEKLGRSISRTAGLNWLKGCSWYGMSCPVYKLGEAGWEEPMAAWGQAVYLSVGGEKLFCAVLDFLGLHFSPCLALSLSLSLSSLSLSLSLFYPKSATVPVDFWGFFPRSTTLRMLPAPDIP